MAEFTPQVRFGNRTLYKNADIVYGISVVQSGEIIKSSSCMRLTCNIDDLQIDIYDQN